MKTCAIGFLLIALAVPANAVLVHDEGVNGDLSTDPAAPTALVFSVGGNTITGTTGNTTGAIDRDYITFTIPSGRSLIGLNLIAISPDNLAFTSFNAGATSFVPSVSTAGSFLAGIHISAPQIGMDLMPFFVTDSVTGNSLASPDLGPGTYCFLIQQTSAILQSYSLEFVFSGPVPAADATWGAIKALYK